MYSAFGIDHGEIYKADDKYGGHGAPSGGRRAAGHFAYGFHGAVAGRKGKKLRATGNEAGPAIAGVLGGGAVGGVAGNAVGMATHKPALGRAISSAGTIGGGIAGSQFGVNRNQRKGYYKPQKGRS